MFRKEKKTTRDEQETPEVLLARILALRTMLTETIKSFMDVVGKRSNVVDTDSVVVKLIGKVHDVYLMFTPEEQGDVKLGDLRAFSGWDLVDSVQDKWDPKVTTITEIQVDHSDLSTWDKVFTQFVCDLSSRQAIDELLRRGTYED